MGTLRSGENPLPKSPRKEEWHRLRLTLSASCLAVSPAHLTRASRERPHRRPCPTTVGRVSSSDCDSPTGILGAQRGAGTPASMVTSQGLSEAGRAGSPLHSGGPEKTGTRLLPQSQTLESIPAPVTRTTLLASANL